MTLTEDSRVGADVQAPIVVAAAIVDIILKGSRSNNLSWRFACAAVGRIAPLRVRTRPEQISVHLKALNIASKEPGEPVSRTARARVQPQARRSCGPCIRFA